MKTEKTFTLAFLIVRSLTSKTPRRHCLLNEADEEKTETHRIKEARVHTRIINNSAHMDSNVQTEERRTRTRTIRAPARYGDYASAVKGASAA